MGLHMTAFSWYDLSGRIHHRTIQPGGCGGGAAATCSDPAGGEQVGRTRTFGAFGDGAVRCSSCWTGWGETARIVAPICSRAEGHRQNGHDDELRNRGHICIRRSTRYRGAYRRARPAARAGSFARRLYVRRGYPYVLAPFRRAHPKVWEEDMPATRSHPLFPWSRPATQLRTIVQVGRHKDTRG